MAGALSYFPAGDSCSIDCGTSLLPLPYEGRNVRQSGPCHLLSCALFPLHHDARVSSYTEFDVTRSRALVDERKSIGKDRGKIRSP